MEHALSKRHLPANSIALHLRVSLTRQLAGDILSPLCLTIRYQLSFFSEVKQFALADIKYPSAVGCT